MIDKTCCARVRSARNLFRGDPFDRVAYVDSVLQPGETVKVIGRLHWTIFLRAFVLAVVSVVVMIYGQKSISASIGSVVVYAGWIGLAVAAVLFLHAAFRRWTTELSVTTHRVIYKRGFIWRHTVEMNMDKIESVDVDQSLIGRLFDYGDVIIRGTGAGIEPLRGIDSPLAFRNAVTAR